MSWERVKINSLVLPIKRWNPAKAAPDDELEYIDLSSVDKDNKSITGTTIYLGSDAPSRAQQLVQIHDILVSTVRPNLNGLAYVTGKFNGATASTGYCVLRPNKSILSPRYLFHWLKTKEFIDEMVKNATGANYPAISDSIIKSSTIPLPPLPIQQRIAAVLDEVDALRQKRERSIKMMEKAIRNSLPILEKDFKKYSLADISLKITDGTHQSPEWADEGIPFVFVSSISPWGVDFNSGKYVTANEYQNFRKRASISEGDILYTTVGSYGNACIVEDETRFCFQRHIAYIKPNRDIVEPEYLLAFMQSQEYYLWAKSKVKGIAQPTLNLSDLKASDIILPPREVQKTYIERRRKMLESRSDLINHSVALDNLAVSLQARAFSGALALRELTEV